MGRADRSVCVWILFVVVSRSGDRGDSRYDATAGARNFGWRLHVSDAVDRGAWSAGCRQDFRCSRFAGGFGNFGGRAGMRRVADAAGHSLHPPRWITSSGTGEFSGGAASGTIALARCLDESRLKARHKGFCLPSKQPIQNYLMPTCSIRRVTSSPVTSYILRSSSSSRRSFKYSAAMKLASRSVKSRAVLSRNFTKPVWFRPTTRAWPSTKNFVSIV